MSIFKDMKQKVKDNKGKIVAGAIISTSVISYIVLNEKEKIKMQKDINLLRSVMSENVLSSLKETITKKLRYHQGRLNNGLKDGFLTKADELKRREEIEFFSKELEKILQAESILKAK